MSFLFVKEMDAPKECVESSDQLTEKEIIELLLARNSSLEVALDNLTRRFNILENNVTLNLLQHEDLKLQFGLCENSTNHGELIWKVNDFNRRQNEAIIGKTRALHSAPCYSKPYGYRYCLRLYLHGDGMGKGTHLSLYFVLLKSEYDDLLKWPFIKKISFTVLNLRDEKKNRMECMWTNGDSSSFQRPKSDKNIASGCPYMLKLSELSNGFLKDDCLYIKFNIYNEE